MEPIGMENKWERAETYAKNKGFSQKSYFLDCIRRGRRSEIEAEFSAPEYALQMVKIFEDDFEFAYMTFMFIWPQAARAAVEGGMAEEPASYIYNRYFIKAKHAQSVRALLDLNVRLHLEFAEGIASMKGEFCYSSLVRKCRAYIKEHVCERLTIVQISEALHFSSSYLADLFKRETGETIYGFIQNEKIFEAERLIKLSSLSLNEIGHRIGFCSQSHFTEVFRKRTGITPKQFRSIWEMNNCTSRQD